MVQQYSKMVFHHLRYYYYTYHLLCKNLLLHWPKLKKLNHHQALHSFRLLHHSRQHLLLHLFHQDLLREGFVLQLWLFHDYKPSLRRS